MASTMAAQPSEGNLLHSGRASVSQTGRTGRTGRRVSAAVVSDEQLDSLLHDDWQDDVVKSLSRRVVEGFLSKKSWYFPRKDDTSDDAPKLSIAWAFYEHMTLPRRFEEGEHLGKGKAERGEREGTELYPSWNVSQTALIEWGAGIDLYFITVWFFAFVMLLCGLINIYSIQYFASNEYKGNQTETGSSWLQGSAVCKNTEWVVCTDCEEEDWSTTPNIARDRFATSDDGVNLVLQNLCKFDEYKLGWPNFITLVFLLITVTIFSKYLAARETRFDEDKVTASDYSIKVKNPPGDAKNPDDWRDFFEAFAEDNQVTAVTVALDNDDLIKALSTRRIAVDSLRLKLERGTDMEDDAAVEGAIQKYNEDLKAASEGQGVGCIGLLLKCLRPLFKLIGMMLTPEEIYSNIKKKTEEIKKLQEKNYNAAAVFVTFETEESQRAALSSLDVGRLDKGVGRKGAVKDEKYCFKFKNKSYLLDVEEPPEPSAVRYAELSAGLISRTIRFTITLAITCGMIILASFAVFWARAEVGPFLSGPLTTMFNSSMPLIIKMFLMGSERHPSEGEYQRSVYLKLTLFRWTLSGLLTAVITPFTHTLGNDPTHTIPTIAALLVSELWMSPFLRLGDFWPNIQKHILAPRANTQEEMNAYFRGSWFQLGERYTDFTKVLFVIFFYSALFPYGFFFGAAILFIQYFMDKFCLVRLWQPVPTIGSDLAVFSRRFFFPLTLIFFAMVSSFAWAQYPYDNVCDPVPGTETGFTETLFANITLLDGSVISNVNVTREMVSCPQDWRSWAGGVPFPATPRVQSGEAGWFASVDEEKPTWMPPSQELFTTVYGWTSVAVLFVGLFGMFAKGLYSLFLSLFVGTYKADGDSQHIDFSSNVEIFGYVPEIKRTAQTFPFLCCDTDDMNEDLIGWIDPTKSFDYHNLIFDVPHESLRRTKRCELSDDIGVEMAGFHRSRRSGSRKELGYETSIYSVIKHYPPEWQKKMAKENGIDFALRATVE